MNQRALAILPSFIMCNPNLSPFLGRKLCVLYLNKYGKLVYVDLPFKKIPCNRRLLLLPNFEIIYFLYIVYTFPLMINNGMVHFSYLTPPSL